MSAVKFSSIDLLHAVRVSLNHFHDLHGTPFPKVTYRAKVKLHGTNAGVRRADDGALVCQSRTEVVTSGHFGFVEWVKKNSHIFDKLEPGVTLFGEWCGPGVQGKVALGLIDRKVFAVFAARKGEEYITEPAPLRAMVGEHPDLFVLPWYSGLPVVAIDFGGDPDLSLINAEVAAVEATDPFVKEHFGIDGVGEGLVLYPVAVEGTGQHDRSLAQGVTNVDQWSLLAFKAKGGKHKTVKTRDAVQIEPEVAKSVDDFADLVLAEGRLEQALHETRAEVNGLRDPQKLGDFIAWIHKDVQKECQPELDAAGLTWKQVNKAISTRARGWFMRPVKPS